MLSNYCQQTVCADTRISMYTSMRPDSTGIHDLHTHMRDINPDVLNLPQYMKKNGYASIGYGKILYAAKNDDIEYSWDERYEKELPFNSDHPVPVIGKFQSPELHKLQKSYQQKNKKIQSRKVPGDAQKNGQYPVTEALDLPDDTYPDGAIARRYSGFAKAGLVKNPFSLVVGFRKPHLPFCCSKAVLGYI